MSYTYLPDAGVRRDGGARGIVQCSVCAFLVALALAVFAWPAGAAITLDSSAAANNNSSEIIWPHTVGPGLDRALVVGVSIFSATKTVSAITYGGASLSFLGALDGGNGADNRRVELWILVNPPIGTGNVTVTMSGGAKVVCGSASFFGVDPITPTGTFVSSEGDGPLASLSVSSAAGELVVDALSTKGRAVTVAPGAGQNQIWNDVTRTNGGNVIGAGSSAPGQATTTMTWSLEVDEYWVLGATTLLPAPPRPFLPDAMVKLATEADAAYRYDAIYETAAVLQVATDGILNGTAASYRIRFENDGFNPDQYVITGTGPTPGFDVQYLDGAGVDRTAAVAGGGFIDTPLAPGGSTVWTLNVTPLPATIGGASLTVAVTATSLGDPLVADQVAAITSSISPDLAVTKSVDLAAAAPGQDVTYTLVAVTAPGLTDATGIVLSDSIPAELGFRVGSATFDPGTTSLISAVLYSSDNGASWTYAPAAGSCGAPGGYDYCVTNVRWELSGVMPADRIFTVSFAARVR